MQYHIMQYHVISYNTMSYHTIQCHIMQYHVISYNTMSYHAIPYHAIHHIASSHITSHITSHNSSPTNSPRSNPIPCSPLCTEVRKVTLVLFNEPLGETFEADFNLSGVTVSFSLEEMFRLFERLTWPFPATFNSLLLLPIDDNELEERFVDSLRPRDGDHILGSIGRGCVGRYGRY